MKSPRPTSPFPTITRALLLLLLLTTAASAEITLWQLGGSGLSWQESDSSRVMIDFDPSVNAIRPIYFTPEQNMLLAVSDWLELRTPPDLDYADGYRPRLWYNEGTSAGTTSYFNSPLYVDGLRSTYVTARFGWWTIDPGVPLPAFRFAFKTPSEGYRSDGVPLNEDPVPAFEVSASAENDPVLEEGRYHRLETLLTEVRENFSSEVEVDFPHQYVRFIRFNRNASSLDELETTASNTVRGTVAEFELYGQGVPGRALYRTDILHLEREVNFGRLFWTATPFRATDGEPVETADARAGVRIEARSGRDDDPNIYHEYTDSGKEFPVSRQRYEHELRPLSGIGPQPGVRASIAYDEENWSFWSSPLTRSGQRPDLRNGTYLQLSIALESEAFDDYVRLDSLWIETSPPLADRILGEVALLEDLQPSGGLTQVELGTAHTFAYDLRASFTTAGLDGFDGVRVRTGSRARFVSLVMGEPPTEVEPVSVSEGDEALELLLPERIDDDRPLRLVFAVPVFLHATTFEGEVFDSTIESLPQPIQGGDAGERISTGSLRVLGGVHRRAEYIQNLTLSTGVVTPNGDGVNDQLQIAYELFLLPDPVPVELNLYDLSGAQRAHVELGEQSAGPQQAVWDPGSEGTHLPPGLYLLELRLRSELKQIRRLRPVGIAY